MADNAAETLGIASTPVSSLPKLLDLAHVVRRDVTTCFVGDSGVGKTPVLSGWARSRDMAVHVWNFGHMQPQDNALPMFNDDGTSFRYMVNERLVLLNRDAEDKDRYPGGAMLFLDEINRAPLGVLNAFFTLASEERRIHDFVLHEDVFVVAAMNPSTDGHAVNRFEKDPAMRKRLAFVHVCEDMNAWIEFSEKKGMPDVVSAFLRAQGETAFYNRALRAAGKVFPSPAAWDRAGQIIAADIANRAPDAVGFSRMAGVLLAGVLGTTVTHELEAFDIARAFVPTAVFENAKTQLPDLLTLVEKAPTDPRVVAFRVAAAKWARDTAHVMRTQSSKLPEWQLKLALGRFAQYMTALQSESVQAFLTDVGNDIRGLDLRFQGDAWDEMTAFYEECGLNDLLVRQTGFFTPAG